MNEESRSETSEEWKMKVLMVPVDNAGWRKMASSIIKANLKLAGMNYKDLSAGLLAIGVDEPPKNISSKLVRGTFQTTFFLQALSVIGVERLELPLRIRGDDDGAGG
jgi:hypothetical protein